MRSAHPSAAWGYAFKANLAEAARPLHEYPTLKDFFTRQLKDGVRPLGPGMVSPCDSKIVTFGEVTGERVEHIKGITYVMMHIENWLAFAPYLA